MSAERRALEARAASAEARNQQLVADGVIWIGIGRENDKLRADLEAAQAALKLATEALKRIRSGQGNAPSHMVAAEALKALRDRQAGAQMAEGETLGVMPRAWSCGAT